MAPITPSIEPTAATAGSTWLWTASSSDYPVSEGWALSYAILGSSKLTWVAGYVTNDGVTHTVTIPATVTTLFAAGRYEVTRIWTGSGTYAGKVYSESCPPLTVAADPSIASPGDRVAFAEANLWAVESAITARLAGDQPEEYAIGGRSVTKIPLTELFALRGQLSSELWKLRNPAAGNRTLAVRFSQASS
jgi:hypothetical protein